MSLTTKTLLGLGLGILVGIFFGESARIFQPIGDGFIRMLQMAVLPYFIVALIGGFGRLTYKEAKMVGLRAAGVLVILYIVCLTLVVALPFAFPNLESASFFSTSIVHPQKAIDFLSLYIPANPFNSLSNAIIPAVVLFGIAMGLALIGVEKKEEILRPLSVISDTLTRITQFVVGLTPIGVFALAASASGTMTGEELARLQVYLVAYAAGAVILSLGILPMLVSTFSPFGYRDVLRVSKDALVMGFMTSNLLIVLPLLAENCKKLFEQKRLSGKHSASTIDVIVPISFTFPDIGTLFILLFIPFAAWYTGNALTLIQYPKFLLIGFFSFFGPIEIGMPFLLDQLQIPSDMFQIHVLTLVYVGRFATLVAVMHVTALAVLTASSVEGHFSFNWKGIGRYVAFSGGLIVATVVLLSAGLTASVQTEYKGYQKFVEMDLITDPVETKVYKSDVAPAPKLKAGQSHLDAIRQRGILRVGYAKDSLPFVFTNTAAKFVGLDVDMAHMLAKELGVSLAFVPLKRNEIAERLNDNYCDIVMSGIAVTTNRATKMAFSTAYMDQTLAFIVRDFRRAEFSSAKRVKEMEPLRIGIINVPYFEEKIRKFLPQAKIVHLDSPREFFRKKSEALDAMVFTAEAGSAWTLIYPEFSVAVPHPVVISVPLAYPVAQGDHQFVDFLNSWIVLKKKDGSTERLFNHWVRGLNRRSKKPRWSIIRDVLHWVN